MIFWQKEALTGKHPTLSYLYWLGAFFSGLIVLLAGQVVMGIIFAEIAIFLMHAYHLLDGGQDGQSTRVSYFKRSALIFIGLTLMMVLYLAGAFTVGPIILFGTALYVMAIILSNSDFKKWSNFAPTIYSVYIGTFIFMRVLQPGLATELWVPLAMVFTVFALLFSGLSLLSLSGFSSYYWWAMGLICYLFALQFSSNNPSGHSWTILSILFLMSVVVLSGLSETVMSKLRVGMKRGLRAIVIILFMQLIGALPGLGAALEMQHPLNYILVTHGILVFILSMALVKILFLPAGADNTSERSQQALMGMGSCLAVLFFAQFFILFALGRSGDISGDWLDLDPTKYLSPLAFLGLVIIGLFAAYFLAKNQKYFSYLNRRNLKSADRIPMVNPIYSQINETIANSPQVRMDLLAVKAERLLDRISGVTGYVEERFLQRGVWREGNVYLSSLSRYVRFFHRGSVRFYMFAAIVFFLIWSVFLVFI